MITANGTVCAVLVLHYYKLTVRLYSIAVYPKHQGAGLGKRLMKHAIRCTKGKSMQYISLEADAADTNLLAWYERNGFVKKKRLPNYYARNKHAWKMVCKL